MKGIKTIKKINVIIALIFLISMIFLNEVQAVGNVFSDADSFLDARRANIKCNR